MPRSTVSVYAIRVTLKGWSDSRYDMCFPYTTNGLPCLPICAISPPDLCLLAFLAIGLVSSRFKAPFWGKLPMWCFVLEFTDWKKLDPKLTLQGINISHLGKRKIIFKMPFWGDMLVPRRVPPMRSICKGHVISCCCQQKMSREILWRETLRLASLNIHTQNVDCLNGLNLNKHKFWIINKLLPTCPTWLSDVFIFTCVSDLQAEIQWSCKVLHIKKRNILLINLLLMLEKCD